MIIFLKVALTDSNTPKIRKKKEKLRSLSTAIE